MTYCVSGKSAGYGRGLVDPFHGSVMPRIGFAWNAVPKFVVRGGYGLQNFMEGTGANLRMTPPSFRPATQQSGSAPQQPLPAPSSRVETGMGATL